MSSPWLSVIMPTYNGARFLPAALDSILHQAEAGLEVIAVDDGSTDQTLAILDSYASRLPLRIERRAHVGNWAANSNYGLNLASGLYACFLHQDDFWLPNRLTMLRRLLSRAPQTTLILHPSWFVDTRGRRLGQWRCPLPTHVEGLDAALVVSRLLVQNFIAMPAPTFPRALAVRLGGLDENLWFTPDWDLWLKLAKAGRTMYHAEPLAAFRIHPGSQTILRAHTIADLRHQLETVQRRHLPALQEGTSTRGQVQAAAHFSTEVTLALAALAHHQALDWKRLTRALLRLRPTAWYCFWRDSRIVERVRARLRLTPMLLPRWRAGVPGLDLSTAN